MNCLNPEPHEPHEYLADSEAVTLTPCTGTPRRAEAGMYELSCRAAVAGERLEVRIQVTHEAYHDPLALEYAVKEVRRQLVDKIVEKINPEVRAEVVSDHWPPGMLRLGR